MHTRNLMTILPEYSLRPALQLKCRLEIIKNSTIYHMQAVCLICRGSTETLNQNLWLCHWAIS